MTSDYTDSEIKTRTQEAGRKKEAIIEEMERLKAEADSKAQELKKKGREVVKDPKSAAIKIGRDVRTYNLIDSIVIIAVGVAGYRKYRAGELDVRTIGVGVLGLGIFAGVQKVVQDWFRRG